MENKINEELKSALKQTRDELERVSHQKEALEKAIWDMLNHANMFVLLLDSKMNIVLMNNSLAVKLGFNNGAEAVGRCWLDFIKPDEHDRIAAIHHEIAFGDNHEIHKYREVINDIVKPSGNLCSIKWFNFSVNHDYNLTFSIGIPNAVPAQITEESIRSYYQRVLEEDKTMILSLRDTYIKGLKADKVCDYGGG